MSITDAPDRGWLHSLALHAAIRARYGVESWGGAKPFLTRSLNGHPEVDEAEPGPEIDWATSLGIKALWVTAAVARQHPLSALAYRFSGARFVANKCHEALYGRVLEQCEAHGPVSRDTPLPAFDWRNRTPEEFYEAFVRRPHPVVLRGFATDSRAVREWTFDGLLERFGQEEVLLTTEKLDGEAGKLDSVKSDKVYLHNSEVLFRRHPELVDALPLDSLAAYSDMRPTYLQLFLGREGTGTPFHAAANWNWFFNIEGRKSWSFVDPRHGYLLYPLNAVGQAAAFALCPYADEYDEEFFPAFRHCPVFRVTLEPGDVLFNPPWWWHSVRNVSEKTVGVASRWMRHGQVGTQYRMIEEDYDIDRMRSWLFFAGVKGLPFLQKVLVNPSPEVEPGVTLREKRVRFVHLQRRLSKEKVFGMRQRF